MPAVRPALVTCTLLASVAVGVSAWPTAPRTAYAPRAAEAAPTNSEPDLAVRSALAHVGLAPSALAAAGVNGLQATRIVQLAQGSAIVREDRMGSARTALSGARFAVATLESAVREGARERVHELTAAREAVTSAELALASLEQQLFQEASAGLPPNTLEALRQIDANSRYIGLPLEFRVSARDEAEWRLLRDVLTHEQVCMRLGEPTDPGHMQRLAAFRAEEAVAEARARIGSLGPAIEAAWNAAAVRN